MPVPEAVAVNIRGRSFKTFADVEVTPQSQGDLRAPGAGSAAHLCSSRTANCTMSTTSLGIKPEQTFVSPTNFGPGQWCSASSSPEWGGEHGELWYHQTVCGRTGGGAGAHARPDRHVHALRRRALRRLSTARTRSAGTTRSDSRSPAARDPGRWDRRGDDPVSDRKRKRRPRSPATEGRLVSVQPYVMRDLRDAYGCTVAV